MDDRRSIVADLEGKERTESRQWRKLLQSAGLTTFEMQGDTDEEADIICLSTKENLWPVRCPTT